VQRAKQNEGNVITEQGAAFPGDLRSTSGLGIGDGIENHTEKWMEGPGKTPMEYIHSHEPMKVHGLTVASYGSDDPALGAPVEYIDLRGTTREKPATCKYTGNKYYSEDWKYPGRMAH
jgi:NADH dehydrogenase (ubiquinone) Fe-S protein 6